jgi:uncharacterized protein (TIGR03437 family)
MSKKPIQFTSSFLFSITAFFVAGLSVAPAQTQDNSQNILLKGSYRFRHVAVLSVDSNFDPSEIAASYGTITFDGQGNYAVAGSTVDNTISNGAATALNVSGTYAIGSSGAGYIANPLYPTDYNMNIWGAVAQGVYTGSSTESELDPVLFPINDIFIAIPVGPAPTNASFTTAYQTGLLDFTDAGAAQAKNALFELTPNGKGAFGSIALTGQIASQVATISQTVSGATYGFNNDGSATLTIPTPTRTSTANALFTGTKTIFESADSNFILGWTSNGYDIFFGVKALSGTGANSLTTGLYFTAALENSPGIFGGTGVDSYYGGTNNTGDAAGDGIVHQRLNLPNFTSEDFGDADLTVVNADGTVGASSNGFTDANGYQTVFGDGGQAFVAIGTQGFLSLQVGFHAPSFSGPGVYLNPIGVVNAASFQPVTASIAPGELIELVGTGLASSLVVTQGGQVFPTNLGGVSVTINSIACPIYYVSPTQLAVIVPYAVASNQTGLANIQVTNNKVPSNTVQVYLTDAAPGSFAQNTQGIGLAAALHAATYQAITASNPAVSGETIALFLTGLGTVTPTITDGALGPSAPLSWSDVFNAGNLAVNFNDFATGSFGNAGTISYAGLVPTLAGLYQINVQVPTGVLGAGDDVHVEFLTDAADFDQIQIPYGNSSAVAAVSAPAATPSRIAAARAQARKRMARRAEIRPTRGSGS